jgi:hypothetical protein
MPLYEELAQRALNVRDEATRVRADSRRARELARLLREAHRGQRLLVHCAWCNRLKVGDEWLQLEQGAAGALLVIARSLLQRSSHGICPDCFERVNEQAAADRAHRKRDA